MGNNSKVSYLNLSYSREVNDQHLLKLGRALLSNSTLCTLNLAGCTTISDQGEYLHTNPSFPRSVPSFPRNVPSSLSFLNGSLSLTLTGPSTLELRLFYPEV